MDKNRINQQKLKIQELLKPYQEKDYKSESGNDWSEYKHNKKRKANIKVFYFLDKIIPRLEKLNLIIEEFNSNSFRITDGVKTIDYFPGTNSCFNKHRIKNQWFKINNNIYENLIKELT